VPVEPEVKADTLEAIAPEHPILYQRANLVRGQERALERLRPHARGGSHERHDHRRLEIVLGVLGQLPVRKGRIVLEGPLRRQLVRAGGIRGLIGERRRQHERQRQKNDGAERVRLGGVRTGGHAGGNRGEAGVLTNETPSPSEGQKSLRFLRLTYIVVLHGVSFRGCDRRRTRS
jgi:hypothetical protein